MNTSKNKTSNTKSLFLALAVVLAIGFSAFTNRTIEHNAPKALKAGMITADHIVQPSPNVFMAYTLPSVPANGDCDGTASKQCIYVVTPDGKLNIPSQPLGYSDTDIDEYLNENWLEETETSRPALFTGDYQ